ncbi:MAG: biopolymer transporter ExbD [Planctomycetota bacterium]
MSQIQTPVISKGLVPLLDVIFNLLIFFMILPHGFEGDTQKFDDMNAALAQLDAKLQPLFRLYINKNSEIVYEGQVFSSERTIELLRQINSDTFVVVFVNYDAKEKMVVQIKKMLRDSQLKYVVGTESR